MIDMFQLEAFIRVFDGLPSWNISARFLLLHICFPLVLLPLRSCQCHHTLHVLLCSTVCNMQPGQQTEHSVTALSYWVVKYRHLVVNACNYWTLFNSVYLIHFLSISFFHKCVLFLLNNDMIQYVKQLQCDIISTSQSCKNAVPNMSEGYRFAFRHKHIYCQSCSSVKADFELTFQFEWISPSNRLVMMYLSWSCFINSFLG